MDSQVFHSSTNGSLLLFLPNGLFPDEIGSNAYEYQAPTPSGIITVAGAATQIDASFTLLYAVLSGTVNVASATVTLNGTAVPVSGGAFTAHEVAGTYTLTVTATGYQTNTTQVVLTPGNTTTASVVLQATSTPGGQTSTGPASRGADIGAIAVIAAVVVIAVGLAGLMVSKRKRGGKGSPAKDAASSSDTAPPKTP